MRAFKLFLGVVVLAVIAAAGTGYFLYLPYGPRSETFVEIAPGTGKSAIAAQLEHAGIIRSRYAFEALAAWRSFSGADNRTLKAGEYRFDHPARVNEVYDRLQRGDVFTVTLVVPEGYNLFDIANAVQAAGLGSSTAFLEAAHSNASLIALWSPHATSLEGYLFPDTYKFGRHATNLQMLSTMVKRFTLVATKLGMSGPGVSGPRGSGNAARIVTMASLVEREVHLDEERSKVASVFENRLAAGMPLQTDPAVIYASMLNGTWTGVIHQSELHSSSPYNTYAHPGLPPGPICNPGLAALQAALHPEQTDYLYFVADANGATRFSTTLDEHNANVADYRKLNPGPPAPPTSKSPKKKKKK